MTDRDTTKRSERYCVVGSGANGLIAARALLRHGIEVDIVDENTSIGGIWDAANIGSPMYETCNLISPRSYTGFIGYPMPDDLPDFPRWDQVRDYIQTFADTYDLSRRVEGGVKVVSASPMSASGRDGWRVVFASGEERLYKGVIWAAGQQHTPHMPELVGADTFTGEIIHSNQYKSRRQFFERRVLVVGGGNSGVDIATDAAAVGTTASLSLRRAYWFMPKRILGHTMLSILWGGAKFAPEHGEIPEDFSERIRYVLAAFGDYEKLGLPTPEGPWDQNHGTNSDLLGNALSHGHLSARPAIERLDGDEVVYVDGTREVIDIIVMATGYTVEIPWLDPELLEWEGGQPYFHLGSMSRKVHGLYACGILHFGGDTFKTWDQLFQSAVADIIAEVSGEGSERAADIRENYQPNLRGETQLVDVHRNVNQYNLFAILQMFSELSDKYGIAMPDANDQEFYPKPADREISGHALAGVPQGV